jgi:hypothetical protein
MQGFRKSKKAAAKIAGPPGHATSTAQNAFDEKGLIQD